jgi:putative hydrolase of the HAD superfamily
MTGSSAVDALLFDFGGVLVDIDFRRTFAAWAVAVGTDADTIGARWHFGGGHNAYEVGEMGFGAYCDHLRAMLEVNLTDDALHEGWMAMIGEPMPGIRELLAALEGQIPLYVLSNTNREHWTYVGERFADLLQPFSGIFCSHELGLRKPDAAAFEHVAREMATPLDRIAFFDDFEPNVTGARAAGLRAFHTTRTSDVLRSLNELGLRVQHS